MTMSTTNRGMQTPRRILITRGVVGTLGMLAGGWRFSDAAARQRRRRGNAGKASRKKRKCCKPGGACRKHDDCCYEGGMCVEMVEDGGASSSRRCAAAA